MICWGKFFLVFVSVNNKGEIMKRLLTTAGISFLLSMGAAHAAANTDQWGYRGDLAPQYWGTLDKKFAACSDGKQQSPIDINTRTAKKSKAKLQFDYHMTSPVSLTEDAAEMVKVSGGSGMRSDNGHTVQFTFVHPDKEESIIFNGEKYRLQEGHFHTPSEHRLNGKQFPLEIHLVHINKEGKAAAVGIFVEEGQTNPGFTDLLSYLQKTPLKDQKKGTPVDGKMDVSWFIPKNRTYEMYMGSLTTPPCTEDLQWLVLSQPVQASASQIKAMQALIPVPNSRPLQPLNGRVVEKVKEKVGMKG